MQSSLTDALTYKCVTPSLHTKYTASSLKVTPPLKALLLETGSLFDAVCSSSSSCAEAFDSSLLSEHRDNNVNCTIGVRAHQGWSIIGSSVRLFMKEGGADNGGLEGAVLKGKNTDQSEATTILTIETAPLEGWNAYTFAEGEDELRQPRTYTFEEFFLVSEGGGCIVASFELKGNLIQNEEAAELACPVSINING